MGGHHKRRGTLSDSLGTSQLVQVSTYPTGVFFGFGRSFYIRAFYSYPYVAGNGRGRGVVGGVGLVGALPLVGGGRSYVTFPCFRAVSGRMAVCCGWRRRASVYPCTPRGVWRRWMLLCGYVLFRGGANGLICFVEN